MREPSLKSALFFAAAWIGLIALSRQPHASTATALPPATLLYWIILIALALATGICCHGILHYGRRAWRLADTPIARIRSAPQGYVELYGRARLLPGPPIVAPLSGLPCAWFRYRVEERSEGGRWWPVDAGDSDNLFALDDGAGHCVVDPEGADFVKTRRDVWYGSLGGARTHALWGIGAAYRYTEQRILPGEELHVIGQFRTVGGLRETPDTRREAADLLERWKRDPRRMALFDRNGDGRIDAGEWEAARRAAYRQVRREQLQYAADPEVHLLADPGDSTRPYIIAAFREESRLIRYFQWRAAGCLLLALVGGGLLLALSS
ncbi:MAG: hypothetical protein F9K25_14535 [Candidatus Contendobacter sp.]|nr:MAG: hypothetical protein F9K25_14535 [Candidatus Contendobacter sp.]